MLSARDYYSKCWSYKLGNFRRYSLPETLFVGETDRIPNVIQTGRKTSDDVLVRDARWNDLHPLSNSSKLYKSHQIIIPRENMEEFSYSAKDFVWFIAYSGYVFNIEPPPTKFDLLLQSSWKTACENDVFRYKLDKLETKVLPGKLGFVAQLNPQRATLRRTPQPFFSMDEPFDPNRFNFTKVKPNEIFFSLTDDSQEPGETDAGQKSDNSLSSDMEKNFIIANISPLEYCNVLLVPKLNACRPQVVTADMLRLALHTLLLSGTWKLRLGFNSLGALASVNHLHCHAYYLGYNLPTESLPVEPFVGPCYIVQGYPAGGFVFQFPPLVCKCDSLVEELDRFIEDVYRFVHDLHNERIPHNIFITRGTPVHPSMSRKFLVIRVYVWTREFFYGAKDDASFNVALCELSGHLPLKTEEDFKNLTESDASRMIEECSQEIFTRAKPIAEKIFGKPS